MANFNVSSPKLPRLLDGVSFNESNIDFLKLSQTTNSGTNNFEKYLYISLEPTRVLYDLYEYQGVTYTNNPAQAVPGANFDVNSEYTAWTFNLPIWGYRVKHEEESLPDVGPYSWLFQNSIIIIKDRINFENLPDSYIKKAKIVNYLFTDDNVQLPNFRIQFDIINEQYLEFAYFYRWVKVDNGYTLEYYMIYPYTVTPEVKLKLFVYFLNKDMGNESQTLTI